jgi:hypothetical protein
VNIISSSLNWNSDSASRYCEKSTRKPRKSLKGGSTFWRRSLKLPSRVLLDARVCSVSRTGGRCTKIRTTPCFQMSLENSGSAKGNAKCRCLTDGRDLPLLSINYLLCPNVCASFEIPTLEMDSQLPIRRRCKEASVNGKIHGNFVRQSATTKLAKLPDRGRVVDYVE